MNQVAEGVKKIPVVASRLKMFREPVEEVSADSTARTLYVSLEDQYRAWIDELSESGAFFSMDQALLTPDAQALAVFWTEIREIHFVDLTGNVISRQTPSGLELASPQLVPEG